jgi:mRNA-degrading endonuclease RelE of RelBE toxin-antitoxin system
MHEHFLFLARIHENAARRLLAAFMKDIGSLASKPWAYPVYDRPFLPQGKYRYRLSGKRYRIVYQIVDDTMYVDDDENLI